MKNRLTNSTFALIAAVLVTPAWGFDVVGSKTEARIVPPSPVAPVLIQLKLNAQLSRDIANPAGVDVVVDFQPVGGIVPCVKVAIPVGCFVANRGLHVDDFRACGVRITVDLGRGPVALLIREFEASFTRRRDGTIRFEMVVGSNPPDDGAPAAILGVLGGAALEIVIGDTMGTSLPNGIETVGGVSPQPF